MSSSDMPDPQAVARYATYSALVHQTGGQDTILEKASEYGRTIEADMARNRSIIARTPSMALPPTFAAARAKAYAELMGMDASEYEAKQGALRTMFENGHEPPQARALKAALNEQIRGAIAIGYTDAYTSGEMSLDEAASAIKQLPQGRDWDLEDIRLWLMASGADGQDEPDMGEEERLVRIQQQQTLLDTYQSVQPRMQVYEETIKWIEEDFGDVTLGKKIRDWAPRLLLPIIYERNIHAKIGFRQGEGFTGKLLGMAQGAVFTGELRAKLREQLRISTPEEARALFLKLREIIIDSSGLFPWTQNDVVAKEYIQLILQPGLQDRTDVDWDRLLYNGMIILDGFFWSRPIIRGAQSIAAGRRMAQSFSANMKKLSDDLDAALKSADPNKALLELGFNESEVFKVMGAAKQATKDGMPKGAVPETPALRNIFTDGEVRNVLHRLYPAFGEVTEAEGKAAVARLTRQYSAISGGFMLPHLSSFREAPDKLGVLVNVVYGASQDVGFARISDAINFAKKLVETGTDSTITLIRQTGSTVAGRDPMFMKVADISARRRGKLADTLLPDDTPGPYYIRMTERREVRPQDRILFGNEVPVMNTIPGPRSLANLWLTPESRFSPNIFLNTMRRYLEGRRMESAIAAIGNALYQLPAASRDKVWRTLRQGDMDGTSYTMSDLIYGTGGVKETLTHAEAIGYFSYRRMVDVMYEANDRRLRDLMIQQGFRSINKEWTANNETYGFRNFVSEKLGVKWLASKEADGAMLYDVASKTTMKADEARLLVEKGSHKVFRVKESIELAGGKNVYEYVILKTGDAATTNLPTRVLKYEPGYVPRIAGTDFSVVRVVLGSRNGVNQGADGEPLKMTSLVQLARTRGHADEIAARLNKDGSGDVYEVVDRTKGSLGTQAYRDSNIIDDPQWIFSNRVEQSVLKKAENRELLADPFEATQRNIQTTIRSITWDNFLRTADEDFFRHFKDIFDGSPQGKAIAAQYKSGDKTPQQIKEFLESTKSGSSKAVPAERKRINEALDLWYYLNSMRGAVDSPGMDLYRAGVHATAATAERLFGRVVGRNLAERIQSMQNVDLTALLRSGPFLFMLAGNPTRQAFLQTSQFLFAASAHPAAAGKAVRGMTVMRAEQLARSSTPNYVLTAKEAEKYGKAMGISGRDYAALSRAFQDSGLVEGIKSYSYVGASLYDMALTQNRSAAGRFAQQAGNTARAGARFMKGVGFDVGEINNLTGSFLMAALIRQEQTGRSLATFTRRDWQGASGEAARFSLAMNRAGQPLYQQGILGVTTQFWSIQQKALFAMLPVRAGGSRAWSGEEAKRLALGQALLYGPHGIGLGFMVDDAVRAFFVDNQIPAGPEVQEFVADLFNYGILETALNRALSAVTGEEVRITGIASNFAPASGGVAMSYESAQAFMAGDWVRAFGGAAGSLAQRFGREYRVLDSVIDLYSEGALSGPQAVGQAGKSFVSLFSGGNNVTKAYFHSRIENLIYGQYDLGETKIGEELARAILGTPPRREAQMQQLGEKLADGAIRGTPEEAKIIGRDFVQALNTILFRQGLGAAGDPEARIQRIQMGVAQLRSVLDLADPYVRSVAVDSIQKWMMSEPKPGMTVFDQLYRELGLGNVNTSERIRKSVAGLDVLAADPERQAALMALFERLREDAEGRREMDARYYEKGRMDERTENLRELQRMRRR